MDQWEQKETRSACEALTVGVGKSSSHHASPSVQDSITAHIRLLAKINLPFIHSNFKIHFLTDFRPQLKGNKRSVYIFAGCLALDEMIILLVQLATQAYTHTHVQFLAKLASSRPHAYRRAQKGSSTRSFLEIPNSSNDNRLAGALERCGVSGARLICFALHCLFHGTAPTSQHLFARVRVAARCIATRPNEATTSYMY